jgi:hypothetical protein
MNKDDILNELANNEELREIIFNIAKNDTYLKQELYQEVFIILCKKKESWFQKHYGKGTLEGSLVKIAKNQFNWIECKFNTKIKQPLIYDDIDKALEIPIEESDDLFKERLEDMSDIISLMKCCPRTHTEAYHSTILQAYLRNNNKILATARELKVNEKYVRDSIRYTKEKLKEEILKKEK